MIPIGFGGGCHWCTEAVFQSLRGVRNVEQGFISSTPPDETLSEAVRLNFDPSEIPLQVLVDIHLRTHASRSDHSRRGIYRSAVYVSDMDIAEHVQTALSVSQADFERPIITRVLSMESFKPSDPQFQNYYKTDSNRPFCKTYIDPKLATLRREFGSHLKRL